TLLDGTPLTDELVNARSPVYRKLNNGVNGNEYLARTDYLATGKIKVRWCGAKGDGIADDTNSINKALLAGNYIVIPEGRYLITPTKTVTGTSFGGSIIAQSNQTIEFSEKAVLTIPTQTVGKYV